MKPTEHGLSFGICFSLMLCLIITDKCIRWEGHPKFVGTTCANLELEKFYMPPFRAQEHRRDRWTPSQQI